MFAVKFSILRRRFLRTAIKCAPFVSGVLLGGFWLHCIAGLEDIYSGTALVIAAFAAGVIFRKLPGTVFGKLGIWYIACSSYLNFNLLWPAAFFTGSMEIPGRRGKYSGTFFAGFIAGAVLGSVFELATASLLLSGTFYFLFNRYRKRLRTSCQRVMAVVFNLFVAALFAMLIFEHPLIFKRSQENGKGGMERLTRICSFGLSSKEKPAVLLISRNVTPPELRPEYLLLSKADVISPGKLLHRKYDVIIAEHFSSAMSAAGERLTGALAPGGVLIVPQRYCRNFPNLHWRTLPGGAGGDIYAAAVPDKKAPLFFTPETIDENLYRQLRADDENGNAFLAGTIAGGLTGFESKDVQISALQRKRNDFRLLWIGVLLLIVSEIALHRTRLSEYFCAATGALTFGLVCGTLINFNYDFYGANCVLFLLIAPALFAELPFKSAVLRMISIISVFLLLTAGRVPVWYLGVAALFFSGLTFAGVKSRYRGNNTGSGFEIICLLGFSAGFFLCGILSNSVFSVLAAVCTIKLWLQLQS
ncbi:MAG: hypothetical protein E7054_03800 [Lentisphaerae bacterium]|nr:hypothetical protein [Lentisphaerota bacterium]